MGRLLRARDGLSGVGRAGCVLGMPGPMSWERRALLAEPHPAEPICAFPSLPPRACWLYLPRTGTVCLCIRARRWWMVSLGC